MDEEEQKEEQRQTEEASDEPTDEAPLRQDFLGPREKKIGLPIVPIIIVVVIVALGAGAFVFFRGQGGESNDLSFIDETTSTSSPLPTPTPTPTIERLNIKIQALNGTGIGGEAALLKDKLTSAGYSDVEAGNAKEEGTTTTVAFGSTVPEAVKSEIRLLLEEMYQNVQEKGSVSGDFDVQITTGLRKGQTPKPSPSPTPKPTATPKTTPKASVTPTPTGSPTTSPTASPTATQ